MKRNKIVTIKISTDMATTANKIEKALEIMNQHDWYWCMSESSNAYYNARGSMRAFVDLVATIEDNTIVKALRDLWTAKHKYISSTLLGSNEEAKAQFKAREAELMSIINPSFAMAA